MTVCQWCDERVIWTPRPLDAVYAAFAHVDTGLVACAPDTSPRADNVSSTTKGG